MRREESLVSIASITRCTVPRVSGTIPLQKRKKDSSGCGLWYPFPSRRSGSETPARGNGGLGGARPTSNRGHRDERIIKIRKGWDDSASGIALRLSRATFPDIRLPCRAVATPSGPFVAGWGIRGRDKEAFSRQLVELVSLPRCANGGEALGSKQTSTLETDGMTWFAMPGLGPGFQRLSWIKA
jgi:hypothetical protein